MIKESSNIKVLDDLKIVNILITIIMIVVIYTIMAIVLLKIINKLMEEIKKFKI